YQVGFHPLLDAVQYVDVVPALHREEGGEQPDRSGAGDQDGAGSPVGPAPDPLDVLPRLRHHAGRLQQDPGRAESRVERYGEARLDPPALAREAVALLDPALDV